MAGKIVGMAQNMAVRDNSLSFRAQRGISPCLPCSVFGAGRAAGRFAVTAQEGPVHGRVGRCLPCDQAQIVPTPPVRQSRATKRIRRSVRQGRATKCQDRPEATLCRSTSFPHLVVYASSSHFVASVLPGQQGPEWLRFAEIPRCARNDTFARMCHPDLNHASIPSQRARMARRFSTQRCALSSGSFSYCSCSTTYH